MDDGIHRLVIRRAQMNVFRHGFLLQFEDRKVADIAARFPVRYRAMGEPAVRALVRFAIRRGEKLGIRSEQAVWMFIDVLVLRLGPRYEQIEDMPWAVEVFVDATLSGDTKALLLAERCDIEAGMQEPRLEG